MTDYRDIYTDFEEEMIRSYPRLFKNFVAQPFRGWAHCIGPEWFDIIRTMAVKLESELTEAEQLSFCLSDIKEKHGQLRIYWGIGYGDETDAKADKIITWAEDQTL